MCRHNLHPGAGLKAQDITYAITTDLLNKSKAKLKASIKSGKYAYDQYLADVAEIADHNNDSATLY